MMISFSCKEVLIVLIVLRTIKWFGAKPESILCYRFHIREFLSTVDVRQIPTDADRSANLQQTNTLE